MATRYHRSGHGYSSAGPIRAGGLDSANQGYQPAYRFDGVPPHVLPQQQSHHLPPRIETSTPSAVTITPLNSQVNDAAATLDAMKGMLDDFAPTSAFEINEIEPGNR